MNASLTVAVPDDQLLHELKDTPGVECVLWNMSQAAPRQHFDIVIPPYLQGPELLANLEGLSVGLVQGQSIGYDNVADYLPQGMLFANASTVHETSTAELAVGLAIAMQRGIPEAVQAARSHQWEPEFRPSLADRRVLLVGYGGVSKAIEARMLPFETRITRVASHAREELNTQSELVNVHGIDELHTLLKDAEIVIIAVPLTSTTRHLIGAEALAAMPDDTLVINVARGAVVDTQALVAELRSGRLRAALDVVDPEPLPENHELWECPGVLITPHVGGDTSAMLPRMVALIQRQIARIHTGEPFENIIFGEQQ